MAKLLIVAFDATDVSSSAGFAATLGVPYDVLILSGEAPGIGAKDVQSVGATQLPSSDAVAATIASVGGFTHIASPSSMRSKDVLAYVAGLIDAPMITDVIAVAGENSFKRPIFAGSMIETVEVNSPTVVLTFRASNFPGGSSDANGGTLSWPMAEGAKATIVSSSAKASGRPDLTQAKMVVSGGRPLKTAEAFESVIGGFADAFGAAVGATRAAVDSGIASNDLQVGQTGKVVAPDLYIAAGISGSTQHMAGIKDSKVIVAINTDTNAPIFELADIGLVGDLYTVLPELQAKLKE